MTFQNDKKTYLEKSDLSKKSSIDEKIFILANLINEQENYYTTSSCSGRAYIQIKKTEKNKIKKLFLFGEKKCNA